MFLILDSISSKNLVFPLISRLVTLVALLVLLCSSIFSTFDVRAQEGNIATKWYVATTGSDITGDGSVEKPFSTIQRAIDLAQDSDKVIVLEGRYTGPGNRDLNFKGKAITVQSQDVENGKVMRATIIDAEGQGVIVRFVNDEGPESVFAGFSLGVGDTSLPVQFPGFFEFSSNAKPTIREVRIMGEVASTTKTQFFSEEASPLYGQRYWTGNDPFHQPASTTNYYGSGDVDGDGALTQADVSLTTEMVEGSKSPFPSADVDGNGVVNASDVSLLNDSLAGGVLPGWWNSLSGRTERNAWVNRIMAIDQTNEHPYKYPEYPAWWVCHNFATQTTIHAAFYQGDLFGTQYDGGQTLFNVPLYYVSVSAPNFWHSINAILVGDDPLNFNDWRFIEPQTDYDVLPGMWDMPDNSIVSIGTIYVYGGWADPYGYKVVFFVDKDENGNTYWELRDYDPNLVRERTAPTSSIPDNRPDLWNPVIVPQGKGMILFDRLRQDMTSMTDIHLSDLEIPFVDASNSIPLIFSSQFSRLLDISQAPDGTYHLLWYGKPEEDQYEPGIYHGKLDLKTQKIVDPTRVSASTNLVATGQIIVAPSGEIHVFWYERYGYFWPGMPEFGFYWTRWTGSGWQTEQNLTPGLWSHDNLPNWINRQIYRYFFDVAVSGDNSVVVVWRDNRLDNIFVYKLTYLLYDSNNRVWSTSEIPIESPNQVRGVDLVRANDGVLHLAYWLGPEQDSIIEGRGTLVHRTLIGSSWSDPVMLDDSGTACCGRMAAGSGGEVFIVWERKEGERVIPVWNKYVNGVWGDAQTLSVRPGADAWYPTAAFLPQSNNLVIAWSSRSSDNVTIETQQIHQPAPTHITVTSPADSGPGTLRWAIAAIAPGGTIDFAFTEPTDITLTSGPPLIDKDMTIEGPGGGLLTISGNHSQRVFEVMKDVNATIKLLSITNGRADGLDEPIGGGAIRNFGSLILDNAILTGNQALYGGAIRNQGTLKITNSIFATNKTVDIGTRAAGDGGAIYNEGKLTVLNTSIGRNQAQGGGGILNWGTGIVELSNTSIDNNLATLSGGGIENGDHGIVTISNSSIIHNEAQGVDPLHGGGGIRNFGGTVTINNNSEISNNTAIRGGGIYTSDVLDMTNCTIHNNQAKLFQGGGKGGGIYNIGNTTINQCLISSNSANGGGGGARGGGIYTDGVLTLIDSTVSTNSAGSRVDYAGGGIYNGSGKLTINGSTINNNSLTGNYLGDGGGGLYSGGGDATLTNCTISGNHVTAGDSGGGIYSEGNLTLTNCTVAYNSGLQSGGIDGKATLVNTIVAHNIAHPGSGDCGYSAAILSMGHNLDSDGTCDLSIYLDDLPNTDPRLGPLQDNGGKTATHALLPDSPAIDAGDNANCPNTDQRGVLRPQEALCDIGAYELVQSTVTAEAGITVSTSISPSTEGEAGASIVLTNNTAGSGSVEITVAAYAQNPTSVPVLDVGGGFVDLQVNGADPSDVLVAKLYYPPTVTGTVEDQLSLLYFDGTKWTSVKSSGNLPPEKDTTNNLDETTSGGRFLVTYDDTSIPKITELSGTAFTFVVNMPPQIEIGAGVLVNEGDAFFRTGTLRDPDSHSWMGSVDYGDSSEIEALVFKPDGTFDLSHTYQDNGSFTVLVTVSDEYGGTGTGTFTVTVNNIVPIIVEGIHITGMPVLVKTNVAASAVFTDPGSLDTHTANWDWGDGTSELSMVDGFNITGSHAYKAPGLYTMTLSVSDDDGGSDTITYQYVVVYDPGAGFLTGGGWINSTESAYTADPNLTGKANFGFVMKYQKMTNAPVGNTEFHFKDADLNFKSTSFDWMVIAGTKAQFKGTGSINGASDYSFMITVIDGSPDMFRIKIWDTDTCAIVYDNMPGAEDHVDPTTIVQGGSIVFHKGK